MLSTSVQKQSRSDDLTSPTMSPISNPTSCVYLVFITLVTGLDLITTIALIWTRSHACICMYTQVSNLILSFSQFIYVILFSNNVLNQMAYINIINGNLRQFTMDHLWCLSTIESKAKITENVISNSRI